MSSVLTFGQLAYPIQGFGSYGGAEEKGPSCMRFTSEQRAEPSTRDTQLLSSFSPILYPALYVRKASGISGSSNTMVQMEGEDVLITIAVTLMPRRT